MHHPPAAHCVQFYGSEDRLIDHLSRFVREGLREGCTCIVLATAPHREGLEASLRKTGLDPWALMSEYRYIVLDAHTALHSFTDEGRPDPQRFHRTMGLLIRQAAARGQPVRVFGEVVSLLAEQGHIQGAIQLEELWNELSRQEAFSLMCAYPLSVVRANPNHYAILRALHSHVLPID